jgi:hypothetical protein
MTDHSQMRLGRRAIKRDSRTLCLARYLAPEFPPAPRAKAWSPAVKQPWGMLLNDQLGDCTIAAALHLDMAWTANAGGSFTPTDADALDAYESIDGYVPGNPSTDQGGIELDVLNAWKSAGIAGRKILAFVAVNPKSHKEVEQAIALFGGLYIGVTLPVSAQTQQTWWNAGNNDGGVWGGHAVPVLDYDDEYLTCVTWGALKKMTWSFFYRYCDEAYAVISTDFIEQNGLDPSGFRLAQLQCDLSQLH